MGRPDMLLAVGIGTIQTVDNMSQQGREMFEILYKRKKPILFLCECARFKRIYRVRKFDGLP